MSQLFTRLDWSVVLESNPAVLIGHLLGVVGVFGRNGHGGKDLRRILFRVLKLALRLQHG